MDMENLKSVIEALIFASESAITINSICGILEGVDRKEVREAIEVLSTEYAERNGGFFLEEVAGGYRFRTQSEHAAWLKRLFKIGPPRISKAAMESLSIIAYRQPITRSELEAIRGVDAGGVLAKLLDKRLIKITGRQETPGRPVVYGTTKEFLETFDLKSLSCLPSLKEFKSLEEEYDTEEEEREEFEEHAESAGYEGGEIGSAGKETGEELDGADAKLYTDADIGESEEERGAKECDTGKEEERSEEYTQDVNAKHDPEDGGSEGELDETEPEDAESKEEEPA